MAAISERFESHEQRRCELGGGSAESADSPVAPAFFAFERAVGKGENFFVGNADGRINVPWKAAQPPRQCVVRKARAFDLERCAGNR